ncbi:hypothetical protein NC651_026016 [Populus alba x Populus x berolinensis]|nr:hypothetical protein NC651_026016 [Populus alba x Populus x berolinensis]
MQLALLFSGPSISMSEALKRQVVFSTTSTNSSGLFLCVQTLPQDLLFRQHLASYTYMPISLPADLCWVITHTISRWQQCFLNTRTVFACKAQLASVCCCCRLATGSLIFVVWLMTNDKEIVSWEIIDTSLGAYPSHSMNENSAMWMHGAWIAEQRLPVPASGQMYMLFPGCKSIHSPAWCDFGNGPAQTIPSIVWGCSGVPKLIIISQTGNVLWNISSSSSKTAQRMGP